MFLGPIEQIRRNIGVRLGLWSAFIFALSCVALLALAYYVLAAALGNKDREVLQARLREYAVIYHNDGVRGLRTVVRQEEGAQKTFFIRLVSPWNEAVLVSVPDEWVTFHDLPSGLAGYRQKIGVWRIPKNEEKDFVL
ncbi:MAG: hypothetical protein P4L99_21520, partial [Chthoniobacter sp.]|nr:hypothetical protein [Chthoniobacter sp.]